MEKHIDYQKYETKNSRTKYGKTYRLPKIRDQNIGNHYMESSMELGW